MNTYYFSFGQSHIHLGDGSTLDKEVLLKVEADDSGAARDRGFAAFGQQWSMQYDEADMVKADFDYFPRGSVVVPGI